MYTVFDGRPQKATRGPGPVEKDATGWGSGPQWARTVRRYCPFALDL